MNRSMPRVGWTGWVAVAVALCWLAAPDPAAAAAWCRDVSHAPIQPKSGEAVKVSAVVAAGVTDVSLQYQLVEPGDYIELKDPAYAKKWVPLPMRAGPPAKNNKGTTYAVQLPGDLQKNRRLVRYRITGKSVGGQAVTSPGGGEDGENHAYFVYDGVPAWAGAIEPKSNDVKRKEPVTFPPEAMRRVQAYHLLGKKQSVENATWNEQVGGKDYKYTGTLVVGGEVFDHVGYRARGGGWRYAMAKNQWKFDLPSGQRLKAKDDFGRPYPVSWGKVNLRGAIQMGQYGRRGEQGLYESVGLRLFNLAGVPAPRTHYVQLRVVDEPEETPSDQYRGDFWGLYVAIENEDGRFLKGHGLPDGNLYKMMNGSGDLGNQGKGQPGDKSDLNSFVGSYVSDRKPDDWWQANLDLQNYYSYRSIVECVHQYDIAEGKNYDYYRNPKTGKWMVFPWDLDLTWGDHMYGNGDEPFNSRVLSQPSFRGEYQNRLREVRDLLYNPDQTGQLIDEAAAVITGPPGTPTIAEADRRKWDFHPIMAKVGGQAGTGLYYQAAATKDFAGMVAQMKAYVVSRGKWIDDTLLNDPKVPAAPTATYAGTAGYPAAKLKFKVGPYQGAEPFAGMAWRLAEVAAKDAKTTFPPTARPYEIAAVWESGEQKQYAAEATVPADAVKPGRTYRLRARVKDAGGRWSHWSPAVEFVAGG
ncbi:MAG: hypothetical protein JWO31_486 [Phycisphaerales bacterium]|nr:hypothetical protein [Phycisphaerales bacterium]